MIGRGEVDDDLRDAERGFELVERGGERTVLVRAGDRQQRAARGEQREALGRSEAQRSREVRRERFEIIAFGPDVVTPNFLASTATVLLGIGDGHFEPAIDAGPTGRTSYGIAAGDFDGDGRPDFATANASSNDVTVKMSTSQ